MANPGQELATLDFSNLIGGPLNAVIEAQAKAAISTTNFVKSVGFNDDNKVITTDFKYDKEVADGTKKEFTLTVPFLTLLPIPYIEVEEASIGFNANITSTTHAETSSEFSGGTTLSAGGRYFFVTASLKANASYQKKTSSTNDVKKAYSMTVQIKARQADLPAGTGRILSILENVITETESQPSPNNP